LLKFLASTLQSNTFNYKIEVKVNNWINPKIIIGNTATGDYYFDRPEIINQIWDEVKKGNHVLIAAPRRVGKSSVMEYMIENCPKGTKCIFRNIQGIKSEEDFYEALYEVIISCLKKFDKIGNSFIEYIKGIKLEKISSEGLDFGDRKAINYLAKINELLPKLKANELKIVLFLDELPEVLHNLHKAQKSSEAKAILDNLRTWRLLPILKEHFCMVLAGSVGIHHVVKTIDGRISDINDLGKVKFEALAEPEAQSYINWATDDATVKYDDSLRTYLLAKIVYPLPYFINLMLDEINQKAKKINDSNITSLHIDKAFDNVVKYSDHFVEWKNRLFEYFPKDESEFMNEVLIHIAHKDKITKRKLFDLAGVHQKTKDYIELMDGLERDGYITEQSDNYVFVSPFLKAFWKRNNPIYNGK
jgi:uncharacterized protein